MKSTVEILREARAYLSDPARWHQGHYGDDARTCMVGGVKRAVSGSQFGSFFSDSRAYPAVMALARSIGDGVRLSGVFAFNDSTTHAEMLAAFDRAIANEEAREQEFTAEPLTEPAHA
jgi:hypothetical protein